MTLADLLAPYRAAEAGHAEAVYPLVADDRARRVCAAWGQAGATACSWRCPPGPVPEDLGARWAWIWRAAHVRLAAVARAAGLSDVRAELDLLRDHRLIYPDGTIHEHARAILQAEIAEALRGALGRRATALD